MGYFPCFVDLTRRPCVVIGGGEVAERKALGGTCVNYGCTPTKTMVASAQAAHDARTAARLGVKTGRVRVDLAAVVDRKDRVVRRWRESVSNRLRQHAPARRRLAEPVLERPVDPGDREGGHESGPHCGIGPRRLQDSRDGVRGQPIEQ